ncbi:CD99 antigen-like protein 2 isoform X2 [Microcaecilia unicolor]|uniref:CD99 antigen-like protein 2 n=1 Tax=Microcaecilia unicolor TaxID=1415580 RepID=A0A6P7YT98_9AMPH|nr:CD99 antigen-like protein 2 isoform X2 [Microcaecilia unicolor]
MAAARSPGPLLLLLLTALCWGAYGTDDFSLEDAVDGIPTKKPDPKPPGKPSFGSADPKPPRKPSSGSDDFNLDDYFDTPSKTTTKRPRTTTKSPAKKTDQSIWNLLDVTTTKSPKTNKPVPQNKPGPKDFDLSDALDNQNDRQGGKQNSNTGGGGFSDSDLADILDDGSYKPDKKKGGDGGGDSASDSMAETGTIAGIASALAMALIGAVSSYISYQQKKFCFSIQQGLNAEYVKGENMEGVVTEEPPVKYTALDMQASEPPPYEHPKI